MKTVTRTIVEIAFKMKIVDISTFSLCEKGMKIYSPLFMIFDTVIKCVMKLAWKGVKNFLSKRTQTQFRNT